MKPCNDQAGGGQFQAKLIASLEDQTSKRILSPKALHSQYTKYHFISLLYTSQNLDCFCNRLYNKLIHFLEIRKE